MIPERHGCRACGKPCLPGAYRCESCSKPHAPAADGSRLFDRPQAATAELSGTEHQAPAPDLEALQAEMARVYREGLGPSAIDELAALLEQAGATVTFDPSRGGPSRLVEAEDGGLSLVDAQGVTVTTLPPEEAKALRAEASAVVARALAGNPSPEVEALYGDVTFQGPSPSLPGTAPVRSTSVPCRFEPDTVPAGALRDFADGRGNWVDAMCQEAGIPRAQQLDLADGVAPLTPAPYETIRWEPGMGEFVDAVLRGEASPYVNTPLSDLDEVGDGRRLTCLSGGLHVPPGTHVAPPPVDPVAALGQLLRERLPAVLHLSGCAVDPIRAARVAQGGAPQPDDPVRVVVRGRKLPGVAPMVFDAELTRGDITTYAELGGLEAMADELVRSARVALQNEGELMRRDDVSWLAASKGLRILTPGADR
jgi:hypothetical protein